MNLNFSGMMDEQIKATIIHQFGHALGLGHALTKPDDWNSLKKRLHSKKLKWIVDEFHLNSESDSITCNEASRYDDNSIMKFRYSVLVAFLLISFLPSSTLLIKYAVLVATSALLHTQRWLHGQQ